MNQAEHPRIVFAERLSSGVVVHFEKSVSVFFPAQFLYEHRGAQSIRILLDDEEGLDNP